MPQLSHCHPEQLEKLLDGSLNSDQQKRLTAHLDSCASCRQRLDQLAAEPDIWNRASIHLQDDPFDLTSISALSNDNDDDSGLPPIISQVIDMLQPSDDPEMLGRIGAFEVTGVVGAGGMGVVLKAHDRSLDRIVAIKVMAPYLASNGAARQRFAREARAAAAVIHPNVIAIHSVATDASLPYLVMPYVAGCSLQKRLDQEGALPLVDILRIGAQVAAGLAAAHGQGLVHRDIKPANILLEQGVDRLVITDFGLARTVDDAAVTRTGVIAGTPQYMSPEQARGEAVDTRSDLFSLGSVLYTVCTGRVPFRAETALAVLRRITDEVARPIQEINSSIPPWLIQIVQKLHSKLPNDRFASAAEVADLLTRCLAHATGPAEHPLPEELQVQTASVPSIGVSRFKWKRTFGIMAVAASVLILIGGWRYLARTPANSTSNEQSSLKQQSLSPSEGIVIQDNLSNDNVRSSDISGDDAKALELQPQSKNLGSQVDSSTLPQPEQRPQVLLPGSAESAMLLQWNDNLEPVLQHIEQSLRSLKTND